MSEQVTKQDVQDIVGTAVTKAVDELTDLVKTFMGQVDERFNAVEQKVDHLQEEIVDLKASHDRLLNTIDGFLGRIDKYEAELAARDNQFEKLLAWAKKVSAKTGIPLEDL